MNDSDRPEQEQLPLPKPRSPAELDRKILAYASAQAPRRRRVLQPWFTGGLATAALLVVAVLIIPTEQPGRESSPAGLATERLEADARSASPASEPAAGAAPTLPDRDYRARSESARMISADQALEKQRPQREELRAGAAAPGATTDRERVLQALPGLARLMEQGEAGRAQQAWDELLSRCPDCDLPRQLTEALAQFPPTPRDPPAP